MGAWHRKQAGGGGVLFECKMFCFFSCTRDDELLFLVELSWSLLVWKYLRSILRVITDASHPCSRTASWITILFVRLMALLWLLLNNIKTENRQGQRGPNNTCTDTCGWDGLSLKVKFYTKLPFLDQLKLMQLDATIRFKTQIKSLKKFWITPCNEKQSVYVNVKRTKTHRGFYGNLTPVSVNPWLPSYWGADSIKTVSCRGLWWWSSSFKENILSWRARLSSASAWVKHSDVSVSLIPENCWGSRRSL